MALTQIEFVDKETLNSQPSIADKNKVTANNMNEIKSVVNGACTQVDTNTTDITNLQNGEIYSTNEVKTNKIWIDNKPIYRKVFNLGSMSANQTKSQSIVGIGIETVVSSRGFLNSSSFLNLGLDFYNTDFNYIYVDTTSINVKTGYAADNVYVILEYTKV